MFKDSFFYWTPLVTGPVFLTITILNSIRALENLRTINDFNFTFLVKGWWHALRKVPAIAAFAKQFQTKSFRKSYWPSFINFSISFLLAFCQGGCFLLIEDYGKYALRKELVIAPFEEQFKTAASRKSSWWISLVFTVIC